MALHYLGKGRILTLAQVAQATSIVGRDVSDDVGMERLLWREGVRVDPFPTQGMDSQEGCSQKE